MPLVDCRRFGRLYLTLTASMSLKSDNMVRLVL